MVFEALQSELFRFKFHSLSSKILKIPEFSLCIWSDTELVFDMWPLIKIKYRSKSSVSLINIPSIQYLKYISSRRKRQKEVEPFCSPLWFLKMDRKGWNIGTWNSFYNSFRKWLWWISGEKHFRIQHNKSKAFTCYKRGCVFPMVIWPEFCMGQYRVNDHLYHAPQFKFKIRVRVRWKLG